MPLGRDFNPKEERIPKQISKKTFRQKFRKSTIYSEKKIEDLLVKNGDNTLEELIRNQMTKATDILILFLSRPEEGKR